MNWKMRVYDYEISYVFSPEEIRMQVRRVDGDEFTLKSVSQNEIESQIDDLGRRVAAELDPDRLEATPRWIEPRDLVEALRSMMVLN